MSLQNKIQNNISFACLAKLTKYANVKNSKNGTDDGQWMGIASKIEYSSRETWQIAK